MWDFSPHISGSDPKSGRIAAENIAGKLHHSWGISPHVPSETPQYHTMRAAMMEFYTTQRMTVCVQKYTMLILVFSIIPTYHIIREFVEKNITRLCERRLTLRAYASREKAVENPSISLERFCIRFHTECFYKSHPNCSAGYSANIFERIESHISQWLNFFSTCAIKMKYSS